jgi:hypothetical protein
MRPVYLEESWCLYVVDVEKKHMLVMDLTDASKTRADMESKHGANALKIRQGLRRAIHECFTGWHVSARGGLQNTVWICIPATQGIADVVYVV